ncbi:MAG: LemA family protein [Actinomycetota bacterium]|nr:LemA family protein [Actinomycetota bacterium]
MRKKITLGCVIGFVAVIIIIAIVLVAYVVDSRNKMATKEIEVDAAWAQVQVVYERRLALVPNLAESTRAYMQLEKDILETIAEARAGIQNAETPTEIENANKEISSIIGDIRVVVEDTPELKASETVRDLMVELEGTENRIAVERGRFNDAIRDYNTYIKLFPRNIIAGWFGFEAKEFFEAQEGAETVPEVNLELE